MLKHIITIFSCAAIALGAGATTWVVRLADHGILPGDGARTAARIDSLISALQPGVAKGECITLRFEPGVYHLHAADATPRELYTSNHDMVQPKRTGIYLRGWEGLTLDGNGAELMCHGRMVPIAAEFCTDLRMQDLTIDFADVQLTQVEIVEADTTRGTRFRPEPWVGWQFDADGRFEAKGEGWTEKLPMGIVFERDTRHIAYRTGDTRADTRGSSLQPDGSILAPAWKDARLLPGMKVAMRGWRRPSPGIFLNENVRTHVEHINVHYAEGMGLIAQRCTDITLRFFKVGLRGADDPRYFSTQADATHFSQCRGRIESNYGIYEGMMDDAINIHGVYLRVKERIDSRTLRCSFEHSQAWGYAWGDPGDTVCFVRSATMELIGTPNRIAAIKAADAPTAHGAKEFIITMTDPLDASIKAGECGIENLTWTPEVEFRGNIVRNNRARGALFSSPRATLCADNLFDHTSGSAILLCGDCNGWFESGAVRKLEIRGNRFVNALTSMYQFTDAVISIFPEIPQLDAQTSYFHGGAPEAIVIENNIFEAFDRPLVYAKSVDGLTVRDNRLIPTTAYKPWHPNTDQIRLQRCINTDISRAFVP